MQGHILEEWRIRDIESKAERATQRFWELDSLRSDVASLERSNGELRSENDRLRGRIETLENQMMELLSRADA